MPVVAVGGAVGGGTTYVMSAARRFALRRSERSIEIATIAIAGALSSYERASAARVSLRCISSANPSAIAQNAIATMGIVVSPSVGRVSLALKRWSGETYTVVGDERVGHCASPALPERT